MINNKGLDLTFENVANDLQNVLVSNNELNIGQKMKSMINTQMNTSYKLFTSLFYMLKLLLYTDNLNGEMIIIEWHKYLR